MAGANIEGEDVTRRPVTARHHFATEREAVNVASTTVAAEPFDLDQARARRGVSWDGDLAPLRSSDLMG